MRTHPPSTPTSLASNYDKCIDNLPVTFTCKAFLAIIYTMTIINITYSHTGIISVILHHDDCVGSLTLSLALAEVVDTSSTVPHIWCTLLTYSYRSIIEQCIMQNFDMYNIILWY